MARNTGRNQAWEMGLTCGDISRDDVKIRETPQHVARICGYSVRHVQHMCATGELPAKKIGDTWAISGPKLCDILGLE